MNEESDDIRGIRHVVALPEEQGRDNPVLPDVAKQHFEQISQDTLREDSRSLRAALKLLAEELNTKESHFILELLQNAEDNEYGGKHPELSLCIETNDPTGTPSADGCLVVLNNEVGFQVENVRSLSSVGQSTKKNRNEGYIGEKGIGFKSVFRVTDSPHIFSNGFQFRFQIPTESVGFGYILPHWVETVPPVVKEGYTGILLPLQPGKRELIAHQLSKIAPETILFLRKIKQLAVGESRSISRDDGNGSLVTLRSNGGDSLYFVHGEPFEKPQNFNEEKRMGISRREVTIAFPLKTTAACTGRIFAFLPTEFDSGLPFLVNADFILNSNRERVLEDRRWNQWLRDEIAPTFVKAFLLVLNEPEWRDEAYRLLPIVADLTPGADFFAPIIESVRQRLQTEKCALTQAGKLVLPEQAHCASDEAIELLRDAPPERAKIALLHPTWGRHWERLKPLGVQTLKFVQLFDACNDDTWLKSRHSGWWKMLFQLCADRKVTAETIGSFPILRCQDGKCRSLASGVFFQPEGQPARVSIPSGWPAIHFLDAELQSHIQQNPTIWAWLTQLAGLRAFSVQAYITDSLLNWMREQTGEHAAERLVEAARFVATNLNSLDKPAQQTLRGKMPWLLADKRVLFPENRLGKELVTPECVAGENGWNKVFDSGNDRQHFCVLHDAYVEAQPEDVKSAILGFMKEVCGATDVPDPAKLSHPSGNVDWGAPQWLRNLTLQQPPDNLEIRIAALERWIGCFKDDFAKFLVLSDAEDAWNRAPANGPSELGTALRARRWLRSTKKLVAPPAGFIDDSEIRAFLQDSVPYVQTKLSLGLLGKLGVHLRLSAETLLDLLRQMRESGEVDKTLVVRIYRRLQTMDFDCDIFRTEQLVFLDNPQVRWMPTEHVFWNDAGPVFDAEFGYAALTYDKDELHSFFTGKLGILGEPDARRFAEVWARLSRAEPDSSETMQARLAMILPKVAEAVETENPPDWWGELRASIKIWTTTKQFVNPQITFIPDDALAEELFSQIAPIAWTTTTRVNRLLRNLGCHSLAASLRSRVASAVEPIVTERPRLLTSASKELIVSWVCNSGAWSKHLQNLQHLLRTEESDVSAIAVEHWLNGANLPKVSRDAEAFWDANDRRLYLRQGATANAQQSGTAASIAAQFDPTNKQAKDTVRCLLALQPEDGKRELAERKWELSPKQREWLDSLGIALNVLKCTLSVVSPALRQVRPATTPITTSANTPNQGDAPNKSSGEQQSSADKTAAAEVTGSTVNQTAPPAPVQRSQEMPRSDKPTTNQEPEPQTPSELHDANTITADFVPVRAHTRSRPQRQSRQQSRSTQCDATSGLTTATQETKAALEQCGRNFATQKLQHMGYTVTPMGQRSPGYDLLAVKPGDTLKVEVKAHAGEASSVFITQREWEEHLKTRSASGEAWELWNVENLAKSSGKNPTIQRVRHIPKLAMKESGYWIDLSQCPQELS